MGWLLFIEHIQLLNELSLIDRISFGDGFVRQETGGAPGRQQRHRYHYLICRRCGRRFSFQEDVLEELKAKITVITKSAAVNHEVRFCSYCKNHGGNLEEI